MPAAALVLFLQGLHPSRADVAFADLASPHFPCPAHPCLQFSTKGTNRFVASVGSSVLPAAKAKAVIPVGISSVVLMYGVLLPAGVKPRPKPSVQVKASSSLPMVVRVAGSNVTTNPAVSYYLGCFNDGLFNARTLPVLLINGSSNLTKLACAQAAVAANLPYFGLQGGNTCRGGFNPAFAKSQGVSTKCTANCTGEANRICGGSNATTLHSFTKPSAPTPTCTTNSCFLKLGCFVEPWCSGALHSMARRLKGVQICFPKTWLIPGFCFPAQPSASPTHCADLAKKYHFIYFSLQNGNECWGSNTTAYAMSHGLSTGCNKTCVNDAAATCGGECANAIYQVGGSKPGPLPALKILVPTSSTG